MNLFDKQTTVSYYMYYKISSTSQHYTAETKVHKIELLLSNKNNVITKNPVIEWFTIANDVIYIFNTV